MFTIFYRVNYYNANRSYFQNQNRYARHKNVATAEEIAHAVDIIIAEGGHTITVYDNCGRRINIK